MARWSDLTRAAPDLAATGKRLLFGSQGTEVALLATVDTAGYPRMAPVCPIFAGEGLYVLVGAATPKHAHLASNGRFCLHAQVGADDLEFQIRGHARRVEDPDEKQRVLEAIRFPSFDPNDPLFELELTRCLAVTWPAPGQRKKETWSGA